VFLRGGGGGSRFRGIGMIRKPTWIALAIFIVLLVFAILWPRSRPQETASEITPTPEPPWSYPFSELVGFTVENFEKGKMIEFQKDAEGQWEQTKPIEGQADGTLIEQTIKWLAAPIVDRELLSEGDLVPFGLNEPIASITVAFTDGTTNHLQVGDVAVTGSMRYVKMSHSSRILLISKFDVNSVLDMVDGDWLLTPLPEEIEPEGTETAVP
jgi:hypothetical protein